MKQKLLALIVTLVLFSGFVWANKASAWTATILAVGEGLGGTSVKIGVASEALTIPAPPAAPDSVKMILYSIPEWKSVWEDCRQEGEALYSWVIGIDPTGDIPSSLPRTATLIWDPSDFGTGTYELRKGYDAAPIVVADMKKNTSYDVVGLKGTQYFTFRFIPIPIPGAIWLLSSGLIGILGVRRKFKK